jgi:signal transduction histidine kinase
MEALDQPRTVRAVAVVNAEVDRLSRPDVGGWPAPRAPVIAWAVGHLVAVLLLVVFAATTAGGSEWWRTGVLVAWVVASSRLVIAVALFTARQSVGAEAWPPRPGRMSADNTVGLFLIALFATYQVVEPLGAGVRVGFLMTAAFMLGLRAAGLDAWEGRMRRPGHYLRLPLTYEGILFVLLGTFATAFCLLVMGTLADRLVGRSPEDLEWLIDDMTRTDQFVQSMAVFGLAAGPILLMCEGVSVVARHAARLEDELAAVERHRERERLAEDLHDKSLLLASLLAGGHLVGPTARIARQLESELRSVHMERTEFIVDRPIDATLTRTLALAADIGVEVDLSIDDVARNRELSAQISGLLERLLWNQVANSAKYGGRRAVLEVGIDASNCHVRYWDDGSGFDWREALHRSGGLSRVTAAIMRVGGNVYWRQVDGATVCSARVPLDMQA